MYEMRLKKQLPSENRTDGSTPKGEINDSRTKQCKYNVPMGRVRATNVAVEKQ